MHAIKQCLSPQFINIWWDSVFSAFFVIGFARNQVRFLDSLIPVYKLVQIVIKSFKESNGLQNGLCIIRLSTCWFCIG